MPLATVAIFCSATPSSMNRSGNSFSNHSARVDSFRSAQRTTTRASAFPASTEPVPKPSRVGAISISGENIFSESFDNKWIAFNDKFSVNSIEFDSKFNSFGIPDGNYSFVVYYSPQRYVDLGTKISIVAIFGSLLVLVCLIVVKKKTNTYS